VSTRKCHIDCANSLWYDCNRCIQERYNCTASRAYFAFSMPVRNGGFHELCPRLLVILSLIVLLTLTLSACNRERPARPPPRPRRLPRGHRGRADAGCCGHCEHRADKRDERTFNTQRAFAPTGCRKPGAIDGGNRPNVHVHGGCGRHACDHRGALRHDPRGHRPAQQPGRPERVDARPEAANPCG